MPPWRTRTSRFWMKRCLLLCLALLCSVQGQSLREAREARVKSRAARRAGEQINCPQYLQSYPPETTLPVCGAESMAAQRYLEGSWVRLPEECHIRNHQELAAKIYPYEQECGNPEFMCGAGAASCDEKVLLLTQWAWKPHVCTLLPFDTNQLSQKVAGKRVLFIGDSTMRQQFGALTQMMTARGKLGPDPLEVGDEGWTTSHNATFSVHGVQFLTGEGQSPREPGNFDPSVEKAVWLKLVDKADYLIFNTGFHHHRRDPQYEHYQEMVDIVIHALKQRKRPEQKFFFQSSVTAHVDCVDKREPLQSYVLQGGKYSWDKPGFNEWRWAESAGRIGLDNFGVLNTSISHLRADGHTGWKLMISGENVTDCLHQCSPGVPDFYNWVVFHSLMLT